MAWTDRKKLIRQIFVVGISVVVIVLLVTVVEAGSLNPTSAPSSTMKDLENVNAALVGTFDSSGIASSSSGSAIQIGRCILEKLSGGSC